MINFTKAKKREKKKGGVKVAKQSLIHSIRQRIVRNQVPIATITEKRKKM
jgi:hypothetical protein